MKGIWGKVSQFFELFQRELTHYLFFVAHQDSQNEENMEQGWCCSHYSSYNRSNYHGTPSLELPITHKWKAYKTLDLIPGIVSWYHPLLFAAVFSYFAFKTHWNSSVFALTWCTLCLENPSGELLFSLQDLAQVSSALWHYMWPFQPEGFFFFFFLLIRPTKALHIYLYSDIISSTDQQNGHQPFIWVRVLKSPWVCEVWGGLESPRLTRALRRRLVLPHGLRKADIYNRAQALFNLLSTRVVIPVPTSSMALFLIT